MAETTTTTITHDSRTCTENDGQPCDQCLWAEEAERTKRFLDPDTARHSRNQQDYDADLARRRSSQFNTDWANAPRTLTRLVEREVAEMFWLLGRRSGIADATRQTNADLQRMVKGRMEG